MPDELYPLDNTLPFSLDAEQSVLGALLMDASCAPQILELLKPEAFYLPQHKTIFSAVQQLFTLGAKIDFVTIFEELRKDPKYDPGDGRAYLTRLAQLVPSLENIEAYANIVREKYYVRSLIQASKEIITFATEGHRDGQPLDASALLDAAEQRIYDIRKGRDSSGLRSIKDILLGETLVRISQLSSPDAADFAGIPTGMGRLDRAINGLNRSDLILLAARPGMGKTSLALNMARNVAVDAKKPVAIFSLEMTCDQLVQRMLSSEAGVDSKKFRSGKLTPEDWARINKAVPALANSPLLIDDSSNITIPKMKAKLRRQSELGLVIIDYLQLMSSGRRDGNRVLEISEITRELKIMAKELDVPILTLSQLSREVEKRKEHRPVLSDLRDSGSIEQDADIVMFLYRAAKYENERTGDNENDAELIIAKSRHTDTTDIDLYWEGQYTRFTSRDDRYGEQ